MTVKVISPPPAERPKVVTCDCGAVLEYMKADVDHGHPMRDDGESIHCPACRGRVALNPKGWR